MMTKHSNVLPFPKKQTQKAVGKGKLKKRFYAFFTDLFFIGLIQKALVFCYFNFVNDTFFVTSNNFKDALVSNLHQMRLPTLVFTFFSYFLLSLYLGHGKTLGKTIFDLRVVGQESGPYELSFMESFMRTMGYTTCYITFSFLFGLVLLRSDRKGLPDLFSQTEVLTEEEYALSLENMKIDKETAPEYEEQLSLFAS